MSIVELERIRLGVQLALSEHLLDARVDIERMIIDHFTVSLRGYLWGEKVHNETIKYPRDWYQSFKARWFPAWALRRWPVVYTVHTIDITALYPDLRISVPDNRHTLILHHSTGDWKDI